MLSSFRRINRLGYGLWAMGKTNKPPVARYMSPFFHSGLGLGSGLGTDSGTIITGETFLVSISCCPIRLVKKRGLIKFNSRKEPYLPIRFFLTEGLSLLGSYLLILSKNGSSHTNHTTNAISIITGIAPYSN